MVKLKSILLVGLIAVPALLQAADFKFYSSHRQGYWFENFMPDKAPDSLASTFNISNNNTFIGASRFGAKVTTDKYQGQVEFSLPHPKNANPYVKVRQAWGKWMFTDKIGATIGITDAPFSIKSTLQGYWEEVDQGKFTGKRSHNDKAMIYQLHIGNAKVALVNNDVGLKPVKYISSIGGVIDTIKGSFSTQAMIPGIEACGGYKNSMLEVRLQTAFNTFKQGYKDSTKTIKEDINAFVIGGDFSLKASLVNFIVGFSYGINQDHAGIGAWPNPMVAVIEDGKIKNSSTWGLPASVTLEFNKQVSLIVGGGMCSEMLGNTAAKEVKCWSTYTSVVLTPIKSLRLIPEIGYIDQDETVTARAPILYYGFKTMVDL